MFPLEEKIVARIYQVKAMGRGGGGLAFFVRAQVFLFPCGSQSAFFFCGGTGDGGGGFVQKK